MQVTAQVTSKTVELVHGGCCMPARVWDAVTAQGVPCLLFVVRVAALDGQPQEVYDAFSRDLHECNPPSPQARAFPPTLAF